MRLHLPILLLVAALSFSGSAQGEDEAPPDRPVAVIATSMGEIEVELFADEAPETVANFLGLAGGEKEFRDAATGEMVKRPFYDGLLFHRVIKGFMIQGGCPRGNGTGGPGYGFADEINAAALGLDEVKGFTADLQPHQHLRICFESVEDLRGRLFAPLFAAMGITSQQELDARMEEFKDRLRSLTLKEAYEVLGYVYRDDLKSHHPKRGVIAMANSGPATNGSQFFINLEDTPHLAGKHTVFGQVVKGMDVVEAIGEVKVGYAARPVEAVKILSIRRR